MASTFRLLSTANAKIMKGQAFGYLTTILHLAPSWLSGRNVCPMATEECAADCLNTTGNGNYPNTKAARLRKTLHYFNSHEVFMAELVADVQALVKMAAKKNMVPAIRLNGTSDLRFENDAVTVDGVEYKNIMTAFPTLIWYDYTKIPNRRNVPSNYHLTFSRSGKNDADCKKILKSGGNVAIVYGTKKGKSLPNSWNGYPVIDGDLTDLRFLDAKGVVVGLRAKGKAQGKGSESGFVLAV